MKSLKPSDFVVIGIGIFFILFMIGEGRLERSMNKWREERDLKLRLESKNISLKFFMDGKHWAATNASGLRYQIDAPSNWNGKLPFTGNLKPKTMPEEILREVEERRARTAALMHGLPMPGWNVKNPFITRVLDPGNGVEFVRISNCIYADWHDTNCILIKYFDSYGNTNEFHAWNSGVDFF